jgi:hypothetical protein
VPSGIKVMNRDLIYYIDVVSYTRVGEANAHYNTEKYACSFSKMIYYWRQTWNERTNGTTDIEFPFGFVQVCSIPNHKYYICR